nr:MAG TPA: hypothetical protein [Caudoviricetes sp.]
MIFLPLYFQAITYILLLMLMNLYYCYFLKDLY